ncbi:GDP-mannose 4,6-dehydratase [bacterium]|nr:GDP-mannose 4,6-dehydratase [bacterium]
MKTEKALITGGAGFVGSHLVDDLIKNGYEVMIVDNLLSGKKENISDIVSNNIYYDDIGSDQVLQNIIEFDPDICFHLAAQSSVVISVDNPMLDYEHNILQPLKLIKVLLTTNCRKLVFSSSGGTIFGEPEIIPTSEKDFAGEPESPYGVAKKRLNELIELLLEDIPTMSYSILNFSNVYGPRQDPNGEAGVISIFTSKMMNNTEPIVFGDGKQTRDYIYVQDVVDALIKSSKIDENLFLNIGTGVETSVNELVSTLKNTIGYEGKVLYYPKRDGELLRSVLDNSKAKKVLGWDPKFSLNKGIIELIQWLKA